MDILEEKIAGIERRFLETNLLSRPFDDSILAFEFVKVTSLSTLGYKEDNNPLLLYNEGLIAGLYGTKIPFLFLIIGKPNEVSVYCGVKRHSDSTPKSDILHKCLTGSFPGIQTKPFWEDRDRAQILNWLQNFTFVGALTGIPSFDEDISNKFRLDRLERFIRGMYGTNWAYLVICDPISEQEVNDMVFSAADEIKTIFPQVKKSRTTSGIQAEEQLNRLAQHYIDLLEGNMERLKIGKSVGMWHTGICLFTQSEQELNRGGVLLKSIFSGEKSLPEPIRFSLSVADNSMRMNESKTVLNSKELAIFACPPQEEMPGYEVKNYARFDVCLPETTSASIVVGSIIDRGADTNNDFNIKVDDLCSHVLIAGVTGSGKTNTSFWLLNQLWVKKRIPFLVIEPAKSEYRSLKSLPGFDELRIYILGDERYAPFRLNPFEFPKNVAVQTHIDHLKSVFNASFVMYAPMPYVLEQCLHEIYVDKGWDLTASLNRRLKNPDSESDSIYPTLTDLYRKIEEVVSRLGYGAEITMNVKAALKTRIDSLRIGGKGLMLDIRRSLALELLLEKPVVLELERIGDDEEKSFVIGLILMKLYENYVSRKRDKESEGKQELNHITVIEEAHRLFKNVPETSDLETANIKGKAVEAFCNILSEIRAYGEGIIICEQIPTKLAPDAIKNTNLKIMHRIVAQDDREVMGGSMNLNDDQKAFVASLDRGYAAVYAEGMDRSSLVRVEDFKTQAKSCPLDNEIGKQMRILTREEMGGRFSECEVFCPRSSEYLCPPEVYNIARGILTFDGVEEAMRNFIYSWLTDVSKEKTPPNILFDKVERVVAKNIRGKDIRPVFICALVHGLNKFFEERGGYYGWMFEDVSVLKMQFLKLVLGLSDSISKTNPNLLSALQRQFREMCSVEKYPFRFCHVVCSQNSCFFRLEGGQLLVDIDLIEKFTKIINLGIGDEVKRLLRNLVIDTGGKMLGDGDTELVKRVGLCFLVQQTEKVGLMQESSEYLIQLAKKAITEQKEMKS